MEVKRPIPRQRLRADWGRAVADGLSASQLSGDGVLRTPAGTSIPPIQPPPVPVRPARRPFDVQLGAYRSSGDSVPCFSVVPGKVWYVDGTSVTELTYSASAFTTKGTADGFDGTHWVVDAPANASAAKYACACLTYSGSSAAPAGWTFRLLDSTSRTGETCLPVAILTPASGGGWKIDQLRLGEIFVQAGGDPDAAHSGEDDSSEAVEVVLDGYGAVADQTTWEFGDTDQATGKPTYPTVRSPRLYWDQPNHRLLCFRRSKTYNTSGCLIAVSAESAVADSIVFTTEPENF